MSSNANNALNITPDDLAQQTPEEILEAALTAFPNSAISFSGAEDVVLIDMAAQLGIDFNVFTLDTGRLHPETYRYIEQVREHYGIQIETMMPNPELVNELVQEKGLFSFYKDGHNECCSVRKIEPLRRKLSSVDAWITGQRRDQSVTRTDVPVMQLDAAFSTEDHELQKFNPIASWDSADVWAYIRANDVPYNSLHDKGFVSIGCEPCTRAVAPHEHERAGRWWWEEATRKECGLHAQNVQTVRLVS